MMPHHDTTELYTIYQRPFRPVPCAVPGCSQHWYVADLANVMMTGPHDSRAAAQANADKLDRELPPSLVILID